MRLILITPEPIPTENDQVKFEAAFRWAKTIYHSPMVGEFNVLAAINTQWQLEGFDIPHYLSYFMEETARDTAPVYIVYHAQDEVMTQMREKMDYFKLNRIPISLQHPQSYEEMIAASALTIGRSFGSRAQLGPWQDTAVWWCHGGEKTTFKSTFFGARRSSLKVVR